MNLIQSEKVDPKSSLLLDLDPRIKIISIAAFILAIGLTPSSDYIKFLIYFCAITALFVLSRIPIKKLASRLFILLPLLAFLGISVFAFGSHSSSENINILWNLSVKSILIFLCIGFLVLSTRFFHLIKGFELLKTPSVVISVLTFAYRYIFLFSDEAEKMRRAKKSRTYKKQNLTEGIKTLVPMVSHLFLRAFERTENIYAAMLSRGFDRKIETLSLFKTNKNDWIFLSFFLLFLLSVGVVL
ncbi:MAG: cobalt ECF transporter T component CbiQ [Acidobacteriota bacterium]